MKTIKILMMVLFTIFSFSLFAQSNSMQKPDSTKGKMEMKQYSCPMKCEGNKTYSKPGQCPKCGMDLKEKMPANAVYSCPMKCEGDKTYDKAGKCPKCGMNLKAVKKDADKKDDHSGHGH